MPTEHAGASPATRKSACFVVLLVVLGAITGCSGGGGSGSNSSGTAGYYVDAGNGDDAHAGTSPGSAWRTLDKVSNSLFANGTTIYLKRGETWFEQLDILSSGVTIDAFGSGASPVIDGSFDISGWTALGGSTYSKAIVLASGEAPGNVTENGAMLAPVAWDSDCSTTLAGAALGSYSFYFDFGSATGTVCIKTGANPATNAYVASRKLYGINAEGRSDITIRNVKVQRFSLHGINLSDCASCTVESVTVLDGGGSAITATPPYLYAGNGIQCGNACSQFRVTNATVSNIFDSGISPQTYADNQTASTVTIENSTVDKSGFAGVEVSVLSNGGTTGSVINNVTLSNLNITDSGRGWSGQRYGTEGHGMRIIADNGAGTMSNVQVQRSTISGSVGDGIRLAGEIGAVNVNRTRIDDNTIGINVSDPDATTLKLVLTASLIHDNNGYGVNFNAPSAAGFNLYHNTLYDNAAINFAVFNQTGEARLQNNLFYSSGAMTHLYVDATLSGATVNNNCYNNVTNMVGYNSVAYSTVTGFNLATGFEVDGIGGPSVDLTDAVGGNFTLQATSQCRAIGASGLGIATDYAGNAYATTPSSGAYEY